MVSFIKNVVRYICIHYRIRWNWKRPVKNGTINIVYSQSSLCLQMAQNVNNSDNELGWYDYWLSWWASRNNNNIHVLKTMCIYFCLVPSTRTWTKTILLYPRVILILSSVYLHQIIKNVIRSKRRESKVTNDVLISNGFTVREKRYLFHLCHMNRHSYAWWIK